MFKVSLIHSECLNNLRYRARFCLKNNNNGGGAERDRKTARDRETKFSTDRETSAPSHQGTNHKGDGVEDQLNQLSILWERCYGKGAVGMVNAMLNALHLI